jgi:hypothetical protein
MGYKDDNYSTKVCGHHPETCTCRDWDTKEERERGITITNVDKQETIKEVAKAYSERHQDVSGNLGKYLVSAVFQDGAKYQAERMYSESIEFGKWLDKNMQQREYYPMSAMTMKELFEQFKKK